MAFFSKRHGHRQNKIPMLEAVDQDQRTALWNQFDLLILSKRRPHPEECLGGTRTLGDQPLRAVIAKFWMESLKLPIDTLSYHWDDVRSKLRSYFFECDWYDLFDMVEHFASYADSVAHGLAKEFTVACNVELEREGSAYRFVGTQITPITNEVEISTIEDAQSSPYVAVGSQINSAVGLLSKKPKPDPRNCIKEAISAVETAARLASGSDKGELGKLLPKLQAKLKLHGAQVEGFKKLYGYTSDDKSGIRHAMMDKDNLTVDDAKYMLIVCSAFANYLLRLAERAKILKPKT